MRKQSQVLRHVANPALADGNEDSGAGIGENSVIETKERRPWPSQPGNEIKQGSLPCTGGTENGGDSALEHQVDFKAEMRQGQRSL